jgi:hypothetical protein
MRTEDVGREHTVSKWFKPRAELDAFSVVFHDEKAYAFRFKDRGPVEQATPRWWSALDGGPLLTVSVSF